MNPATGPADELAGIFARLSGMLLTEQTVNTSLATITSLATDTLGGSNGSGITLLDEAGERVTSAATHPTVRQLDDLQYELEDGPCLTAWRDRVVVRSGDIPHETRWPAWAVRAAELDMRSVLSAPMIVGQRSVGAIKVYSTTTDAYDDKAADLLRRFAEQAAIFVGNLQTGRSAEHLSDQLKETLRVREQIATARGMLMAQQDIGADEAYRRLLAMSHRERQSVHDLAERIVTSRRGN